MRCKACKHWISKSMSCDRIGYSDTYDQTLEGDNDVIFIIEIADDYGLDGYLKTGPDFGCVLFCELDK